MYTKMTPLSLTCCGLTLRKSLRVGAVVGIGLSTLYITLGTGIVTIVSKRSLAEGSDLIYVDPYTMVYKGNDQVLLALTLSLILLCSLQIISDIVLFHVSLQSLEGGRRKVLWALFCSNLFLWSASLLCFVIIFSGNGLLLLIIFLAGSGLRAYVLHVIRQLIQTLRKPTDSGGTERPPEKEPNPHV